MMAPVLACLCGCADVAERGAAEPAELQSPGVRASQWGFDRTDATRCLQAAIDSHAPRLIVDHCGAPWITDKIRLASNQEIVFEKGVEIVAKKGAFLGRGDALFSLICVSNVTLRGYGATLRMRRSDYDAPPYAKAEWRHALNIQSCANIRVLGLTLTESGGDGIYLGCQGEQGPNRDVLIRDVVCEKNYRQGISVISAENLLIENTVMRDTAGTAPEAGIDFEPNRSGERLKNCVMRNCVTSNNRGDGYDLYLPNLTRASEPLSIRIENCRSTGDRAGVRLTTGNADEAAVRGSVTFADCRFERAQREGIGIADKPALGASLTFSRCAVAACGGTETNAPEVQLSNDPDDTRPVGGVRFDALTVEQPVARPWIAWRRSAEIAEPAGVSGSAILVRGGHRQALALTSSWAQKTLPPKFAVRVPRLAFDPSKARVSDQEPDVPPLSPLRVRSRARYVFYGRAGSEVVLAGRHDRVGSYEAGDQPLTVSTFAGSRVASWALPPIGQKGEWRFVPSAPGFYALDVDVGANAFALLSANVPVALDASKHAVGLIASEGPLFVAVPPGADAFAVDVSGEGSAERVRAAVSDPSGRTVWSEDGIAETVRFSTAKAQSGVWRLDLRRPSSGAFEDFRIDVRGVPGGFLFLSHDRYWQ